MSIKETKRKILAQKVLCSLLAAGVMSVVLPACTWAADMDKTLTGSQEIIETIDGKNIEGKSTLTVTDFTGSVNTVQNFDKVIIKDNSVIAFNDRLAGVADEVSADATTTVTVNGLVKATANQTISLNGTTFINSNVWASGTNAIISIGGGDKKTVINGNVYGNSEGEVTIKLHTADSHIAVNPKGNGLNYIDAVSGKVTISGIEGTSVTTNTLSAAGGGIATVTGAGMKVTVETEKAQKAAVSVSQSSTATLGTVAGQLAKLTAKGTGCGLLADNEVGNVNLSKGPELNVAADNVFASASNGVGIWANISNISAGDNVKAPVINILGKNITASGNMGAVIAQDGIVNIGSLDNLAENVTLRAVENNTTDASVIYVRGYSSDQNTGTVNIYSKNIKLEAVANGAAIAGNGGGHEKVNLDATNELNISGSIMGYNEDQQPDGTSKMQINVNQDIVKAGKVIINGKQILAADQSSINIKGGNGSVITADIDAGISKKSGGKINIDFADGGTVIGNITAQNGGSISVKGADIFGAINVDGGNYTGTDTTLKATTDTLAVYSGTDKSAVIVKNGGKAVFDGSKTEIKVDADHAGKVYGVILKDGEAEFNADNTVIDVTNKNSIGIWDYAVDVKENSKVTFGGKDVNIKANKTDYTAQTFTVRGGSTADFNNQGATVISAASNASVTALDVKNGGVMNVNSASFTIDSEIAEGKEAAINAIGIQIHSESNQPETTKLNIGNAVKDFSINVKGQGYDYDGTSYSSGTAALKASDSAKADIRAQKFTADVLFNNSSSGDGNHNIMAGLWTEDKGKITAGEGTDVIINVTKTGPAAAKAYAVWSTGTESDISLLDNTSIGAYGKEASYALYAEDSGQITVGSEGKTVSLTGDVVSENSGVVTLAGDTNTVKGIVKANGGSIVLNGGDKATYDVDKFVTTSSGKITVRGGTLNIDELKDDTDKKKFDLAGNSLEVTGKGVLQAAAKNIFDATGSSASKVADAVDAKVLFSGGKLAISDASYKLADSKAYSTALAAAESNVAKTTLVMTGTLQQEDIPNNTAGVEDLAPTGAVHTQVTGTVESNTLNIGGAGTGSPDTGTSVNNDLGVKDLDFSGSGSTVERATVNISNDTGLTLVGDGSGNLLKGTSNDSSKNTVTVGSTESGGSAGTLTLGSTAVTNSGGTLNAEVKVQADSQMKVEAGSFTVNKIEASQGTVAVNEGAALKTTELIIGTSTGKPDTSTAGAVHAAGTVEVDKLTVNKGTVAVSGSLAASELKASDGASIAVGTSENAGTLTAKKVQLNGASIVLDPAWRDGNTIATASKAGLEFANSHQIDGKLTVGQNSVLSLGTTDTSKAEAAFAATGLIWGKNDITAALYIDTAQTLDNSNGGIKVDGTLTHESLSGFAEANTAEFADKSLLMVNSAAATTNDGALKATNSGKLTVDSGAKLYIADAQAGQTYTVASGFSAKESSVDQKGWKGDNLLLNKLVTGTGNFDSNSGSFTVTTKKVKANEALPGVALPNILDAMTSDTNSEYAGVKYLSNAISGLNTDAQTIASVNAFAQGAENSGASHSSVLAAFDTGSIVQGHLSLANKGNEQRGGFGKAAADGEDNGGIWAQYIHNKDKSDLGYEGQYNGFVLGGDFAAKGKYSSGVAFSYGSGDSTGSASKNEYDFWGLSYYGGIRNDDTNLIFDVGYSKNSSEIKGVVNADPDTRIITLGVKGEKMYTNGHGTKFVPYAGLRYMNVDTDSYTGTIDGKNAANYRPDKADLWLLPVGVRITNETVSESGWKVRPTADIAYVWTMGDNDNAMGITVPGINAQDRLGYELMDSGFFVGRLGLEAEKDDWTYGVSYSYQKGSDAQSNKWFVDVKYSF